MSTHLKEKEERLLELIDHLVQESAKGTLIVVEGKKDVSALRTLGVEGPIATLKTGGKSFQDALLEIEQANPPETILLLDFDRQGREATRRLRREMEKTRIKSSMEFWNGMFALTGKEIQCVESLSSYLETLRKKQTKRK